MRILDFRLRNSELRDLRCAIWDVRFKTEDAGLSNCGFWISDCGQKNWSGGVSTHVDEFLMRRAKWMGTRSWTN